MTNRKINELSDSEQLMYCTIRIESEDILGNVSTGTGFYFQFDINDKDIPVIITNKHVIKGGIYGNLVIKLRSSDSQYIIDGQERFRIGKFEESWIMHPDPEVDLCCLLIGPIINEMKKQGKHLFYKTFYEDSIITKTERDDLTAIEDITMIGYPNGLWDEVNNHPIMRHGKTATHPAYNYNGKEEFLIDVACYHGSSGSPVVLFNQGVYLNRKGEFIAGTRLKLLGVLYAGPQVINTGEIKIATIETRQEAISITRSMMNLGIIIKSEKVLDLKTLVDAFINKH
ncbi:S1 family peptidase [Paenibacillus shenyangensis]|uniref:S1 family peptidase n=1 Tax=Paenibacillus sp. A9 TaxID=1284352 RepID=UPI0003689451|nr:serine protease [Paenibacillus sp. A9]